MNVLRDVGSCCGDPIKLRCTRSRTLIAVYKVEVETRDECSTKSNGTGELHGQFTSGACCCCTPELGSVCCLATSLMVSRRFKAVFN